MRQLARNSAIEAGAGAIILVIVALLGTLPPACTSNYCGRFARIGGDVFGAPDLYIATIFGAAWIAAGIACRQFRWPAPIVALRQ